MSDFEGFGLAQIKTEGMCSSYGEGYEWNPRVDAKTKYINSLPKYRQSSAKKAWDEALAANAQAIHNNQ